MICFLGKEQPFERGETCSDRSIDHEAPHLYRCGGSSLGNYRIMPGTRQVSKLEPSNLTYEFSHLLLYVKDGTGYITKQIPVRGFVLLRGRRKGYWESSRQLLIYFSIFSVLPKCSSSLCILLRLSHLLRTFLVEFLRP